MRYADGYVDTMVLPDPPASLTPTKNAHPGDVREANYGHSVREVGDTQLASAGVHYGHLVRELWTAAATLLGVWARWRVTQHVGGAVQVRSYLADAVALVRRQCERDTSNLEIHDPARTRAHSEMNDDGRAGAEQHQLTPIAPSLLSASPILCLGSIAASPLCPPNVRSSALEGIVRLMGSAADASTRVIYGHLPSSLLSQLSSAQTLVAGVGYALLAAEEADFGTSQQVHYKQPIRGEEDDAVAGEGSAAAAIAPALLTLWHGASAVSVTDAGAEQTAGLLLVRMLHRTAWLYPHTAMTLATAARAALTAPDAATPIPNNCVAGAAYAAAGVLLAMRRPPPEIVGEEAARSHARACMRADVEGGDTASATPASSSLAMAAVAAADAAAGDAVRLVAAAATITAVNADGLVDAVASLWAENLPPERDEPSAKDGEGGGRGGGRLHGGYGKLVRGLGGGDGREREQGGEWRHRRQTVTGEGGEVGMTSLAGRRWAAMAAATLCLTRCVAERATPDDPAVLIALVGGLCQAMLAPAALLRAASKVGHSSPAIPVPLMSQA